MIHSDRVPGAESLFADVEGCRLHYLRAGEEGPPVVLLHGSGIDDAALSWKLAIPALADQYQVYALDWPGHGQSEPVEDGSDLEPSVPAYESILTSFLDSVGIDTAAVVGISMGGAVAIGTALDHPDRCTRLVLVDSYGLVDRIPGGIGSYLLASVPFVDVVGRQWAGFSRATTRTAIGSFVHDPASLPEEFVGELHERLSQPGAGAAFVSFQRNEFGFDGVDTSYADRLSELRLPVTLIHGREDPLIPLSWSESAVASIPDAQLRVIDDCGHWPPREQPEAFERLLLAALEGEQTASSS